ncbi:NAD(P)/FAD-dependent oxidoreductase [Georgenia wangjunii]|uniref:NAD(P)/FAD-dependent oxidoreductase n=1 Tax=Georgenia wangjunii TaxID=3117730 RepID=UPI002F262BCD
MSGAHALDGSRTYDVVVIGGGVAGLSGALTLARARRSVLVIDSGEARNAPSAGVHNYLGREGTPPGELDGIGREEVARYGGRIVPGAVTAATRDDDGLFAVTTADGGSVRARRLLVTTGVVDELPDVAGLAELWGRSVLHCPYCHGWEVRDRAVGIVATDIGMAMHQALLWRQWTDDLVLFQHTAQEPTAEQRAQLDARGIRLVVGEVAGVEAADGAGVIDGDEADGGRHLTGVRLASGEVVERHAVAVATTLHARADFLGTLGLEPAELRFDDVVIGEAVPALNPMGATAVPGVYVAGNVTNPMAQVIVSAAAGMMAGAVINGELATEDTERAVATRAAGAVVR